MNEIEVTAAEAAADQQQHAKFWFKESRRSIAAIELAIENGLNHHILNLTAEAVEDQESAAIHYRCARIILGIVE